MKLIPFISREAEMQPGLVQALEELLVDAKAGKLHRMAVICYDDQTGCTHQILHRAVCTEMIGAVSNALFQLQAKWQGMMPR